MYETCKIQQSIYLSPAFETVSPVVVFVNHLEYTDEKNTNLGLFCWQQKFSVYVIKLRGREDTQHVKKLIEREFDDMQEWIFTGFTLNTDNLWRSS